MHFMGDGQEELLMLYHTVHVISHSTCYITQYVLYNTLRVI